MILTVFIVIAWIITSIFWVQTKRLSLIDYLILWFINSIVIVSVRTLLSLNMGWVELSEGYAMSLTYLLRRSFIDPMFLLIAVNVLADETKRKMWKVIIVIAILGALNLLEYVMVKVGVLKFIHFNYFAVIGMYIFFLLINQLVGYFLRRGGSYEDYRI